jgi:hypothetical protein
MQLSQASELASDQNAELGRACQVSQNNNEKLSFQVSDIFR